MEETKQNIIKPIVLNEHGLIEGVNYKFTEDGFVDWRAMVNPKHLYINPSLKTRDKIEKKYGKPYNELNPETDKIDDVDLVILLAGIKSLLKLRQYNSIEYSIKESQRDYASVSCIIQFTPNYESLGREVVYSDNACATLDNTNDFGHKYLLEIATNRALARCVRSFLNINIVSREELSPVVEQEPPSRINTSESLATQIKLLEGLMLKKNVKWNNIIDTLKKDDVKELERLKELGQESTFVAKWNENLKSVKDLNGDVIFNLIDRIKKIAQ